jgi:hypothetical protein
MTKKVVASIHSFNDTRGLPATMDPRNFYEYSSQRRYEQADGLEGLLYRLLPRSLIKSFAFAIDPFSQVKMSKGKISPVVRNRIRVVTSALDLRKLVYKKRETFTSTQYGILSVQVFNSGNTQVLSPQLPLKQKSSDTTRRLRVVGSDNGEFSKWKVWSSSPGRRISKPYSDHEWYTPPVNPYKWWDDIEQSYTYVGASARINPTTADNLYTSETALAIALMQSKALGMFKGIFPSRRTYTLLRNIVELRDLPHGITQLRETIKHLSGLYDSIKIPFKVKARTMALNTTLEDIPKEWLSYSFGWRQTYSDMMGLLVSPAKIGKKIDFLIRRNCKPTTFRSKRTFVSGGSASSGFDYDYIGAWEAIQPTVHSIERSTDLRMVCNATLQFPPCDLPNFRRNEFRRQMGVSPTFTDMYNLVPWTWLIDWFTGLGDYVEVIDNINSDNNLVNWALLTADVQGVLQSNFRSKVTESHYQGINGSGVNSPKTVDYNHQSQCHFNLQLRKDCASLFNVNVATETSTLTAFQQSILGSLFFTRSQKFRR